MLFPDLPMGAEAYYIYVAADEQEIAAEDPESFNGKRIGVNKGSIQEGFLKDWAERNHIQIEIVSLDVSEADDMSGMFYGCGSLTSLDLRDLDTSSVFPKSGNVSPAKCFLLEFPVCTWADGKVRPMSSALTCSSS